MYGESGWRDGLLKLQSKLELLERYIHTNKSRGKPLE